ncbi:hypothetical protein PHMEG_00031713, partial [Phytophthora megakarya]
MALGSARPVNQVHAGNNKPKQPVLGERKPQQAPMNNVHYNYGSMRCRFCFGNRNDMDNAGLHKFVDCPKRARDLVAGVKRRNIHAKQGVNAVKKELQGLNERVKAQAKKPKREVTLEECKAKMAVDACSAVQKDVPLTPSGSTPPQSHGDTNDIWKGYVIFFDDDEPMDTLVNAVDVNPVSTEKATAKQSDGDIDMQDPKGD